MSVMGLVNHPENPRLWAVAHETARNTKMTSFGHASQTCTECHWPCKLLETPKLWAIAHENGHKRKNNEFWDMPLKHVVSVMGLVNHLGNPKQWAITHENGPKTQK
jgi:hypothetical protein